MNTDHHFFRGFSSRTISAIYYDQPQDESWHYNNYIKGKKKKKNWEYKTVYFIQINLPLHIFYNINGISVFLMFGSCVYL